MLIFNAKHLTKKDKIMVHQNYRNKISLGTKRLMYKMFDRRIKVWMHPSNIDIVQARFITTQKNLISEKSLYLADFWDLSKETEQLALSSASIQKKLVRLVPSFALTLR